MMNGSYGTASKRAATRLLLGTVAVLTSQPVTDAWIRPQMWIRGLATQDRRSGIEQRKNILVARLDGIGDLIMTGPFLRELRRAYPDAWITLIVDPRASNLVEGCPHVDRVLTFRAPSVSQWWHPLSRRLKAHSFARRHLWGTRYDVAIVPRWGVDFYEATALIYLSGAPFRAGYSEQVSANKQFQNPGYDRFLTNVLDDRSVKHEVQRNLDILPALQAEAADDGLEMWLSEEDENFANETLPSSGAIPLVALALGAGHPRRIWPIERFAEVGRWLAGRGARLVVVGGPGEEGLGEEMRERLGGGLIDLTNRTTLRQTAAVIRHCSLFVGNDAGPMHMAAAVGVPVVEISCHSLRGDDLHSNSPKRFGPWGVPHRIVRPEEPGDECAAGCLVAAPHCILNVTGDSVIAAIESLMEETALLGGSVDAS